MIEVVILKTGEDMKKLILLGIQRFFVHVVMLQEKRLKWLKKMHICWFRWNIRYADKLNDLWNRSYPKQKDALHFVVQPYYFTQDIKQDIIWTNDIDATFFKR